jgi:hypothetical protein
LEADSGGKWIDYGDDVWNKVFYLFTGTSAKSLAKQSTQLMFHAFGIVDVEGCFEFVFPFLNFNWQLDAYKIS